MAAGKNGFIVHAFHQTRGNKSRICLLGRFEDHSTFAVIDDSIVPHFYIRTSDTEKAKKTIPNDNITFSPSKFFTMDKDECVKISASSVLKLDKLRDILYQKDIRTYEADIKYIDQYLLDKKIHGSVTITGANTKGKHVDSVYINPKIEPSDYNPKLSILSIDIETNPETEEIYAIGIIFKNMWNDISSKEVLFTGPKQSHPDIICFNSEKIMLEYFKKRVNQLNPDIITGWNVITFDIRIIAERFAHLQVPFQIGRSDESSLFFHRSKGRAKGYAGLLLQENPVIEVKGMEAVRRDWTDLAKTFQMKLLSIVFSGCNIDEIKSYIEQIISQLNSGKLDDKLVYIKSLRKPVEAYTKSVPPHVKAAKLLPARFQHGLIRYVWTKLGPEPVARLSSPFDYKHYIEKQLKPIAHAFAFILKTDIATLFSEDIQGLLFD